MASTFGGGEGLQPLSVSTQPLASPGADLPPDMTQESDLAKLSAALKREKAAKRKMYSYLVKIADELKTLRNESEQLINEAEY
eukprot:CAMPEP_0172541106 /NCGR_PEP_ID=MMETSP1067-20121228/11978_1 /TAXON_ID=265564 ORGANISM="Thalassiosira punctigera, Strain Tpunct2005C2" /NCGR_SAMPLE_ID=MMETSP1067 /ASSEMBLY_ACC=CAM_ASM_000444 /LENGTH=82 /DNA_ID=CAMNT_0013327081 /DNA_START=56 /DNA_END=301 /DNA_ORIENTATION=-